MTISIATWNVNSVRSRLPHLLEWLSRDKPDIVLLQELKCTDEVFPRLEVEDLGYNIALYGEKTYNGVAILSRFPLDDITRGLPGDAADTQARYIEAMVSLPKAALRVASVYVPNGQEVGSDKYAYKLRFLERLRTQAQALLAFEEILVIGGDYNIAPYAADVHDPKTWEKSVLFCPEMRDRLRAMLNMGLYDAFRLKHPISYAADGRVGVAADGGGAGYTWWDYRANALAANDGLRIDHLLLSPQAADRLTACTVEKEWRALEKPSDHAPVVAELSLQTQ